MNQDVKMVLCIVQESLIEGDASPVRQKELAEMLERVISGGLTPREPDKCFYCEQPAQPAKEMICQSCVDWLNHTCG